MYIPLSEGEILNSCYICDGQIAINRYCIPLFRHIDNLSIFKLIGNSHFLSSFTGGLWVFAGSVFLDFLPSLVMISIFSFPGFFTMVKSSLENISVILKRETRATIKATAKTIATSKRLATVPMGRSPNRCAVICFSYSS